MRKEPAEEVHAKRSKIQPGYKRSTFAIVEFSDILTISDMYSVAFATFRKNSETVDSPGQRDGFFFLFFFKKNKCCFA